MNDRLSYRIWDKEEQCYKYNIDLKYFVYDILYILRGIVLNKDNGYFLENEIEQCIGSKDIDDKLIFEGDILSFEFENDEFVNLVVKWDQENCRFCFEENGNVWDWEDIANYVKVIGNIHENSDLIGLRYFKYDGVEVKL